MQEHWRDQAPPLARPDQAIVLRMHMWVSEAAWGPCAGAAGIQ